MAASVALGFSRCRPTFPRRTPTATPPTATPRSRPLAGRRPTCPRPGRRRIILIEVNIISANPLEVGRVIFIIFKKNSWCIVDQVTAVDWAEERALRRRRRRAVLRRRRRQDRPAPAIRTRCTSVRDPAPSTRSRPRSISTTGRPRLTPATPTGTDSGPPW